MALNEIKDVEEYFQLLSTVRETQTTTLTAQLCAFVDLLSNKLHQNDLASVKQGLSCLKTILEHARPILDRKDNTVEQDHQELMTLATGSNGPIASALILKDLSRLDPSH